MEERSREEESHIRTEKELSHQDHGYAWVVLGAAIYLGSLATGNIATYGILLPEYVQAFRVTKARATLVQSLSNCAGIISGVLAGTLVGMYGIRRVGLVGAVIASSGIVISSFVDNLNVLYFTHGMMPGLGLVFCFTSGMVAVATYFNKRKSLAFSLFSAGSSIGFILWTPIFRLLITEYGRKGGLLIYSGIYLNGIVSMMLFRPVPSTSSKKDPDKEKVDCNNNTETTTKVKLILKPIARQYSVLKSIKFVMFLISLVVAMVGHVVPFLFVVARCQSLGYSKEQAALLVSILGLGGLLTRPFMGFVGDRISKHRSLLVGVSVMVCGAINIGFYPLTTYVPLLVFCIIYGICTGGYIGMYSTIMSDLVPLEKLSAASGLVTTTIGITQAGATAFAGWMVDKSGTYATPFLVYGLVQIVGGILALLLYFLQKRDRKKEGTTELTLEVSQQHEKYQTSGPTLVDNMTGSMVSLT